MGAVRRLGRAFWIGLLLIGLSVVVWFIAPQAHSCGPDLDPTTCDTTWVVILNVIGLAFFVTGAMCIVVAGAIARGRARAMRAKGLEDTR
jgi:type VI protein secretion system component VasK